MAKHSSQARTPRPARATAAASDATVVYPDGSVLARPLTIPRNLWALLALIAAVAVAVGGAFAWRAYDSVVHYHEHQQEAMASILAGGNQVEPLVLLDWAGTDAQGIYDSLTGEGAVVVNLKAVLSGDTNDTDLVRLPASMPLDQALSGFSGGMRSMSASEAAQFLAGSWRLTQKSPGSLDRHLYYADFTSRSTDEAISAAMRAQGFLEEQVFDSGVDSHGNTYKAGAIEADGAPCTWTVNVCPLTEVYDKAGLPETSYYVGVRLFANASGDDA